MRAFLIFLFTWLLVAQAEAACTTGALPFNLQNNTIADATQVMANFNQISSGVGTNCAGSGANTDITSLGGLTTPLSQIYGGTWIWAGGTTTGSANAQVLATVTPSTGFSLTQGKCIEFTAGFTNTGPTTLNIFGTGATNVFHNNFGGAVALQNGEIQATSQYLACYDGTQYELMNLPEALPVGARTNIGVGFLVDLGTIYNHNAYISTLASPSTIGSFGGSASTGQSIYYVCFAAAHTLQYNATFMILPGAANITTAAGDCAVAMYLGGGSWQVVDYVKASGVAPVSPTAIPSFLTLKITNNAGTPGTQTDWSWGQATLVNTANNTSAYFTATNNTVNLTDGCPGCAHTVSTCNAMDGEARGTSDWVYFWAVSTSASACVIGSLSSTTPMLPAGYTFQAYAGAMRIDGSGNLLRSMQKGSDVQLVVSGSATNVPYLTPMASAVTATPGQWNVLATGAFVPALATRIKTIISSDSTAGRNLAMAPNPNYMSSNGAIIMGLPCEAGAGLGGTFTVMLCDMVLESTNIYYQNSSTANGIYMYGYKDGVNAN